MSLNDVALTIFECLEVKKTENAAADQVTFCETNLLPEFAADIVADCADDTVQCDANATVPFDR